jgi:putative Mg2+ transporter-C (MgtC) family protein
MLSRIAIRSFDNVNLSEWTISGLRSSAAIGMPRGLSRHARANEAAIASQRQAHILLDHRCMLDSLDITQLQTIATAGGLGALLGIEREFARKPAGVRTHIFVCAGASMMMLLAQEAVNHFQALEPDSMLSADPIRVLQAIVVGISFLGAGTIVHQKGEQVEGLTTAASIFLTAGIGVATAVERTALATSVAIAAVFVLLVVGCVENRIAWWVSRREKPNPPINHPDDSHDRCTPDV